MQSPGSPGPGDSRNVILAIVLCIGIWVGWEFLYNAPLRARLAEERARAEEQTPTELPTSAASAPEATAPSVPLEREAALSASSGARLRLDTPSIDGTIALEGARFDDLSLRQYRRTTDPESPEVALLAPIETRFGHDAFFGWEMRSGADVATLADAYSRWSAPEGARVTPETPVTLTLAAGPGLTVERTIAVDANYMITVTDVIRNTSGGEVTVRPFGAVRRSGTPEDYRANPIVHQGLVGAFGPNNSLHQANYQKAQKHARNRLRGRVGADERLEDLQGVGGWFGITDHYWLAAIIPDQNEQISAYYDSRLEEGVTTFRAAYRGQWRAAQSGETITYTQRFFAGAKRYELLRDYQTTLGLPHFDDAIDWGNMSWPLTRPFFMWLLHPLAQLFAAWGIAFHFGFAILASTIVIKLLMFPLVYQSFKAMAKMRALAPKMKEIQERYAADKQRQQQETLKLYQTEKINPVSGCLPMLLQIPVFFALYKTLSVTIEMRHAPFVGWISDLAARDPTSLFNLFGLLPYGLPAWLVIGAWPILYGLSMWALQSLSPPAADPMQAQIFRMLPILFTVMFAAFPAGLVIYWTWSNMLSIGQQYLIMRRQGVETELDKFIAKRLRRPAAAE